jgi:hypothetical protein
MFRVPKGVNRVFGVEWVGAALMYTCGALQGTGARVTTRGGGQLPGAAWLAVASASSLPAVCLCCNSVRVAAHVRTAHLQPPHAGHTAYHPSLLAC